MKFFNLYLFFCENTHFNDDKKLLLQKKQKRMLRIGIMGAGHLGKIHIKCIQQIPEYEFVGFFDPDQENAKKVAEEYNTHSFASIEELIDEVDVVDIVTPTLSYFDCASKSLKRGKHVFIE